MSWETQYCPHDARRGGVDLCVVAPGSHVEWKAESYGPDCSR